MSGRSSPNCWLNQPVQRTSLPPGFISKGMCTSSSGGDKTESMKEGGEVFHCPLLLRPPLSC